jgi:hypothetical protein
VLLRVLLRGVLGVLDGVELVAVREVRVMARLLVLAMLGMVRRLAMVLGGMLVMFGGLAMMVMHVVVGHVQISSGAQLV